LPILIKEEPEMEIALAVFIGIWFTFFCVWSYKRLKNEYKDDRK